MWKDLLGRPQASAAKAYRTYKSMMGLADLTSQSADLLVAAEDGKH